MDGKYGVGLLLVRGSLAAAEEESFVSGLAVLVVFTFMVRLGQRCGDVVGVVAVES